MTDEEKKRANDLISNLEVAIGQVLLHDDRLRPTGNSMLQNLAALRTLLGLLKR